MISNQIIQNTIDEAKEISQVDYAVYDAFGNELATTTDDCLIGEEAIKSFVDSSASNCEVGGKLLISIPDDYDNSYVLAAVGSGDYRMAARLVAANLKNLIGAYKEKIDRNSYFQNLLLDNLLLTDVYNRARKLHIETDKKRCVFVIEPRNAQDGNIRDMVRELFYTEAGDYVTQIDEKHVIVIKSLEKKETAEDVLETANMLVDMIASEAMVSVRVSYGLIVEDIKGVSKSYKEAKMALDVAKIFYVDKSIIAYSTLGIGRLIYQLPINLCQLYVKEIFGEKIPDDIDDEILTTANRFFDNNLNVSETSRQLYIHRNTLIYRIEKLQKATGLDIRVFDDALTLKIALMVVNYMKYLEKEDVC